MRAGLIFPNQLFVEHPVLLHSDVVVLIEEPLLFRHYNFHSWKLVLHRASMKAYEADLRSRGYATKYLESSQLVSTQDIVRFLSQWKLSEVCFVDVCDDWLHQRLVRSLHAADISFKVLEDPCFLTPWSEFDAYGSRRKKWFFADFYELQRKRMRILLSDNGGPLGGKWSYDQDNRKKLPRSEKIPSLSYPKPTAEVREAIAYVQKNFPNAIGDPSAFSYPVTTQQSREWLEGFVNTRLDRFGIYEDAIDSHEAFLFHSVLTPMLNTGLLSPGEVLDAVLQRKDELPINTIEGFVRQIIGWREYVRGVYRHFGRKQRTANFWGHTQGVPDAFYSATTGVDPVDTIIRRVLRAGYCHHIERLMILGSFMLLCELHPDSVYQWFMELFIDSFDWVMVPNVYGMSQFADGGLITTKPYICSSNYVRKMSNFGNGDWCSIWDGLYWRFIDKHRQFFQSNPRMAVMVSQCNRMGEDKLRQHCNNADAFLAKLHGQ